MQFKIKIKECGSSIHDAIPIYFSGKDGIERKIEYRAGVVSALRIEIDDLHRRMDCVLPSIDIGGRRFHRGIMGGILIVSVISGIGMNNATMATQMMIDYFNPINLFFCGVAGGIDSEKDVIGDVIIPKRWVNIDHQKYINPLRNTNAFLDTQVDFPNTFERIKKDTVIALTRPSCKNCRQKVSQPVKNKIINGVLKADSFGILMKLETITKPDDVYLDKIPEKFYFKVSRELYNIVLSISHVRLSEIPNQSIRPTIKPGDTGISGSIFGDNYEWQRDVVRNFLKGNVFIKCIDMESSAFGHTCYSNNKPFIAIRSIVDFTAENPISEEAYQISANNAVIALEEVLRKI